jgi:hypothetical protein
MNLGKKQRTFAEHLANVFQSHRPENEPEEKESLIQFLETPYQLNLPINRLKRAEVQEVINSLNPKKSSGYNLITGKILKKLTIMGIKCLAQLFSVVLLKGYFPAHWKVAQIILILQPGKPLNELTSIWTYGIQVWGSASTSNIEILERFQSKALRMIVDAPWHVPNKVHSFILYSSCLVKLLT